MFLIRTIFENTFLKLITRQITKNILALCHAFLKLFFKTLHSRKCLNETQIRYTWIG
jgi:hypothetical protein